MGALWEAALEAVLEAFLKAVLEVVLVSVSWTGGGSADCVGG